MSNGVHTLNGTQIYFETYGDGDALLLLHGFSGSSQDWNTARDILGVGLQFITPDLRGHGRSSVLSHPFRHRDAAADMFALLDHLGIDSYQAIGVSGGGNILLHMATQQPARVTAMVLVSATPYFPAQARTIMRNYRNAVGEEQRQYLRLQHPGGDAQIESLLASATAFADSYDDMNFTPPLLATIQARTLIVQGDRDPFIQSRSLSKWFARFRTPAFGSCRMRVTARSWVKSGPIFCERRLRSCAPKLSKPLASNSSEKTFSSPRLSSRMADNKNALKALHDLVATNNDAAEGYGKAAKGVHNQELSNWLAQASADRERFAADLSHAIRKMGEQPGVDLHEGGILHKGWIDLEQRLRSTEPHLHSKDDKEIIRECIAGDSGSLPHYDHALTQELDSDSRELIIEQRAVIEDNLVYLQNRVDNQQSQTA